MFCFLNFRKHFVDLGIPYGAQLPEQMHLIAGESRKSLRSLRFKGLQDVDDKVVISIIKDLVALHD